MFLHFSAYGKILVNYNFSKFLMEKENNLWKSGVNAEMLMLFVFGFDVFIIDYSCGVCICSSYEAFHLSLEDYI